MKNSSSTQFTAEIRAEFDAAVRRALSGVRDAEVRRKACQRMDRMREENLKRFGVQNIAVDFIREIREEE